MRTKPAKRMWTWTWSLLFLLTAGCSGFSQGSSSGLDGEVAELKRRVLALQQQAAVDRVEIEALEERLAALGGDGAAPPVPPPPSPTSPPTETVSRPVVVDGEILEDNLPSPAAPVVSDEPAQAPGRTAIPSTAQAVYDRGYTLYHQERFFEAEEAFQQFLDAHAGTDLADNALYWIGESRVARGELQPALDSFREILRRYPDGNKAPDALLKAGVVLERQGDREGARRTYEALLDRYSDSSLVDEARRRLDSI